jgi:hypothetical protein
MADLTTQILIEIRDEIRSTRTELSERIDQTNFRLDQANVRLDQTNASLDETIVRMDRVERRQVESELRLSTEITTLTGVMRDLQEMLRESHGVHDVIFDHERRLSALESRQG